MSEIKAILINAKVSRVELITIPRVTSFKDIYPIMSMDCTDLELLTYFGTDVLMIDEDGRYGLHGWFQGRYVGFRIDVSNEGDFSSYFEVVGNGIILGTDLTTGATNSPVSTVEMIEARVSFLLPHEVKGLKQD